MSAVELRLDALEFLVQHSDLFYTLQVQSREVVHSTGAALGLVLHTAGAE